tara:strand:+ start:1655 stop:1888 length:234 start_codon:yes stop_codon:yes gene_type:complete
MESTIVTLTLTTVVSLLALLVGGMLGWMARQHSYETTPQIVYTHPEMFDANGNMVPDEILAVRFEQHDNTDDEEDDD